MRKFISILLIVVVAFAVLPFGMGMLTKHQIENQYAALTHAEGSAFQISLKNYHRGWFSSQAQIELKTNHQGMVAVIGFLKTGAFNPDTFKAFNKTGSEYETLVFNTDIIHGPVIVDKDAKGHRRMTFGLGRTHSHLDFPLSAEFKQHLTQLIGNQKLVSGDTLYTFTGGIKSHFHSAHFDLNEPTQNFSLQWPGFDVNLRHIVE